MPRQKHQEPPTNAPRAETDVNNLPTTTVSIAHCEAPAHTNQDLPDNRTKTFMNKPVAEQRKFDDKAAARFLAYYATTGRKADSAKAAGVSYSVVRHWEVNDETFGSLVMDAHEEWINLLDREIFRRGVEGVLEPVVAGKDPEIVTYVRKYSDKCLELAAKKADPTGYGNRGGTEVNVNVKTGVLVAPAGTTRETTPLTIERVEE